MSLPEKLSRALPLYKLFLNKIFFLRIYVINFISLYFIRKQIVNIPILIYSRLVYQETPERENNFFSSAFYLFIIAGILS